MELKLCFLCKELFNSSYISSGGLTVISSALLIGIKQNFPDLLCGTDLISICGKYLYAVFVFISIPFASVDILIVIHTLSGMFSTWIYLRWFQLIDGERGDKSELFSFASFFSRTITTRC